MAKETIEKVFRGYREYGLVGFLKRGLAEITLRSPFLKSVSINHMHRIYYYNAEKTRNHTYWKGIQTLKNPLDMWVYQEIISETEPDIIVECGAAQGGSAHYLADFCDALNHGHIISIDIEDRERPKHDRIKYLIGSSVEDEIVNTVYDGINDEDDVMVILDSDHRKHHVLSELQTYSEIVSPGHYLIVEDTNLNGNPVREGFGPGPNEAIKQFLNHDDRFVIDESREKYQLTFNPGGYLKRVE